MRQTFITRPIGSAGRAGRTIFNVLVIALSIALVGAASLRLPDPLELPKSADSPGKVTFNHETHVDAGKPRCTTCHPKQFRILKATDRTPITHERMQNGAQCGSCHNGKAAFALEQDCTFCHAS